MLDFIKKALHDWDPEGLIRMGAPDDEYDSEAERICRTVKLHTSVEETAEKIQLIMDYSFHSLGKRVANSELDDDGNEVPSKFYIDSHPYTDDPALSSACLQLAIKIHNKLQLTTKS